ncbi:MAG: DNA phosphorothioation-associated putative methyltransferase [Pseudomonadales bacterium]
MTEIERHKTALVRSELSLPMRLLLRYGFLDGSKAVFDYGCGRGDDLDWLLQLGVSAEGWDPEYRPGEKKVSANIVNLGYVLNVIEDKKERSATLRDAFSLTQDVMLVSVMLGYQRKREQYQEFRDGVLTQRNTFQKYFAQDEFKSYLEEVLEHRVIPLAPGICLVFKNQLDEQLFLLSRQQVRREWRLLRRDPTDADVAKLVETYRDEIESYWHRALDLGRAPAPEECVEAQSLMQLVGSWKKVHEWVGQFFDTEELEAASLGRQEDLVVYFALSHFGKGPTYRKLLPRLQRDVQYFFGNITKARGVGKKALFAVGDFAKIEESAVFCHEEIGIGQLNDRHDFVFHQEMLKDCLPLIRIFVGCALQLFGDVESVDLIKVHLQSGKVTFQVYDDFEGLDNPSLVERIKVDLPRLKVDYFEYGREFQPEPLNGPKEEFFLRTE